MAQHLQPLAGRADHRRQFVGVEVGVDDQHRRRRQVAVVLRHEGLQHFRRVGLFRLPGREERPVAEVAAAAHHRQVDAGLAPLDDDRDHVGVGVAAGGVDRLLVHDARQAAELVAHRRRFLEAQFLRQPLHLRFELGRDLARQAAQEAQRAVDVARVGVGVDQPHARRAAAADLVQQARPRAVGVDGVLAGAQAKHLLQHADAVLHRPGVRIGAEVPRAAVRRAAEVGDARKRVRGELQVRVGLVVAEQDVVARRQLLDEVVLEQQRLGLRAGHRRVDGGDALEQVGGARPDPLVEVGADALAQVAGLADVQDLARRIEHPVHAGQLRQAVDYRPPVEGGRGRFVGDLRGRHVAAAVLSAL
ncbi:MAG: hypothetical protein H6R03_1551 [Burkholderiaceae bacterium]|nr:hypothetical protein [Burkholderiaceae bacterium]